MLLLALILAIGVGIAAGQEAVTPGNFLERARRCDKQLTYRVVPLSDLPNDLFRPYANTSAKSEEDCARKCVERTVFCFAARFIAVQNVCQFSAKYIDCSLGDEARRPSSQNVIHCIQCGAQALVRVPRPRPPPPPRSPPPPRPPSPRRPSPPAVAPPSAASVTPAIVRSNSVAIVPQNLAPSPPPNRIEFVAGATVQPFALDKRQPPAFEPWQQTPQLPPLEAETVAPLAPIADFHPDDVIAQFTTEEPLPAETLPVETPLKKQPEDEVVDLAVNKFNPVEQRGPNQPSAGCLPEMMRPCVLGFGRDCELKTDEITGCPVCACPYKSPARGCAGAQGLEPLDRFDMLNGREPCPTDHSMQIVERWYRKVDKAAGIDECYPEKEPYCGWQQDINIWRMPRTKDECNYFCYSDEELRAKGITFSRL